MGSSVRMTKTRGLHPDKALSALKVRQVTKPGRYTDGNGLYLIVDPSGAKRWVQRLVVRKRRRDIGLGSCRLVSLAEARDQALAFRKIARSGGDPLEERRDQQSIKPTFSEAAQTVHALLLPTWKNKKAAQQWLTSLEDYAFPLLGQRPVDEIETPNILQVLTPIWVAKPETARRIRQRMSKILDWAKTAGHRTGDNPVAGVKYGLPKQRVSNAHHASLPYAQLPEFMGQLVNDQRATEINRLAFEFLILTATRSAEVRYATWSEIDFDAAQWNIAPGRMKASREHRVPLSRRAMTILRKAQTLSSDNGLIFPNASSGKVLSENAFTSMLKRMDVPVTAHGFRSSFRDWVAETTTFSGELAEMALAHTIKNKTEAAYRRGDLLERRREMMEAWAQFAAGNTS